PLPPRLQTRRHQTRRQDCGRRLPRKRRLASGRRPPRDAARRPQNRRRVGRRWRSAGEVASSGSSLRPNGNLHKPAGFNEIMRPLKVIFFAAGIWIAANAALLACSWDSPIWPKDKRSDTALFRFVTEGKAGFINASGKIIIPARFPVSGSAGYDDFFEGVAAMNILRRDHIDSHGSIIDFSPYEVDSFRHFSEGLIAASIQGEKPKKHGFIDHRGKLIIHATFDGVGDFAEGLAPIVMNGKWGYVDHAGKIVIPPHFNLAEQFSEGAARVIAEGPCNYVGCGPGAK